MFVIGTDGGGLSHSDWNSNLKLAIKVKNNSIKVRRTDKEGTISYVSLFA